MQTGLSLTELARRIEGDRPLKHDVVVPVKSLAMRIDREGTAPTPLLAVPEPGIGGNGYPILPTAHEQLGAHLQIPRPYYQRMLATDASLLATNVNAWLGRAPETSRRLVRTMDGNFRAFLSDRYQRIENEEIAEVVLPVLLDTPGIEIVSCQITDRKMYIQATTDRIRADVKVGDTVQAGVIITNSETGHGAVSVKPLIYRLVCLNGMIVDKGYRRHHVGRRVDESEDLNAIFADDTRKADDHAILLKTRDVVRHALSEAGFNSAVERMRDLTGLEIKGDPARAVEVLAQKVGASDTERGGFLRALISGGDSTAWGLLNAVTHQAHAGDYDRAVELEAAGGQLLNLSRKDWSEILEAA